MDRALRESFHPYSHCYFTELTIVCEAFQSATDELRKVKKMEGLLLSGKIKATQVKEEIRNVTHRLASQPETYGQ